MSVVHHDSLQHLQVIDGINQYEAIFHNVTSPRTEILLQLDPPGPSYGIPFIGQAAYRLDNWKLIVGQVRGMILFNRGIVIIFVIIMINLIVIGIILIDNQHRRHSAPPSSS